MANLNTILSNKINRMSAGGDGVYGREIVASSLHGGRAPKKAGKISDEVEREFFRFDYSEVDGDHVCGS